MQAGPLKKSLKTGAIEAGGRKIIKPSNIRDNPEQTWLEVKALTSDDTKHRDHKDVDIQLVSLDIMCPVKKQSLSR